jgi:hypothetical protein
MRLYLLLLSTEMIRNVCLNLKQFENLQKSLAQKSNVRNFLLTKDLMAKLFVYIATIKKFVL